MQFATVLWLCLILSVPCLAESGRPRARDVGVKIGVIKTGQYNAITDVPGVAVGQVTLIKGKGKLRIGKGPVRTGVTAILPHTNDVFANPVFAAAVSLNGNGAMTGTHWVNERGLLEVPVVLTNTLSVGDVYSGVVDYITQHGPDRVPLPVVAECWDGELNDIVGRHVKPEHAIEALKLASGGPVEEGSVGAGTGMRAYQFKAGIGTASRVIDTDQGGYTVGVLVNANCGRTENLVVDGIPVGIELSGEAFTGRDGSIILVIATDAPLLPIQLRRLCVRSGYGLTRTGTISRTTSGDLAIAFSTAKTIRRLDQPPNGKPLVDSVRTLRDNQLDPLFKAVIEATEEAVLNAMFKANDMDGINDHVIRALPIDKVVAALQRAGRIK